MLNLHSMCAAHLAHLGKACLLFWILSYCIHLPTCLCSSWSLPLTQLFIFYFFITLVALVYQICYFSVHFYHHQFHFQTDSTAPFHSGPVSLQLLRCLYSLFVSSNRLLLFCHTIYCLSFTVRISFYIFSRNFYLLAPRNCVLSSWLTSKYRYSLRFPQQMAKNSP